MTTLSASDARKRLYNLVDEVKDTHVPVQIVGKRKLRSSYFGRGTGGQLKRLCISASIPGMRESIKKGLKTPVEKCEEDPGW